MNNKTIQSIISNTVHEKQEEDYQILTGLKTNFWLTNGNKHYPSYNSTSEIYVFGDSMLVVRKRKLLVFSWLDPFFISATDNLLSVNTYHPDKFSYSDNGKIEIQIRLKDLRHNHISAILTLKHLEIEQINIFKDFEKRFHKSQIKGKKTFR